MLIRGIVFAYAEFGTLSLSHLMGSSHRVENFMQKKGRKERREAWREGRISCQRKKEGKKGGEDYLLKEGREGRRHGGRALKFLTVISCT